MLLVIFSFCSCGTDDTQVYVCIPEFLETSNINKADFATEKALSTQDIAANGFAFEDPMVNGSVIMSMPIMSGLKPVKFNKKMVGNMVSSLTDNPIVFYPMGVKVILRDNSKIKEDGIYCYYDIMSGNDRVGFVDYYFNSKTNKFSYRQSLIFRMNPNDNNCAYLLVLEYKDVSITDFDMASSNAYFQVGGIDTNNAFIDAITLNNPNSSDERTAIIRNYIIAKSAKHQFASILKPDEEITAFWARQNGTENPFGVTKLQLVYDLFKDTSPEDWDINLVLDVESIVYADVGKKGGIKEHVWNSDGSYSEYENYEEYASLSFSNVTFAERSITTPKGKTIPIWQPYYAYTISQITAYPSVGNNGLGDYATVYNYVNNKGAASTYYQFGVDKGLDHSGFYEGFQSNQLDNTSLRGQALLLNTFESESDTTTISNLGYMAPRTMFEKFYSKIKNKSGDSYYIELVRQHLNACGISDENYIMNFWYAEKNCIFDYDGNTYFCSKITGEAHETFKTNHDKRRADCITAASGCYMSVDDFNSCKMGYLNKERK